MKIPYPFQQIAITVGAERNLLLLDECGCGKKVTAIEIAKAAQLQVGGNVLIVTVKRDTLQWSEEILEQIGVEPIIVSYDVLRWPPPPGAWLVMHYEAAVRHVKTLRKGKWACVVADEAHNIKNWQAQRSSALKRIPAHRRLAMTGTPIDKSPVDLWSLLEYLYPTEYTRRREFEDKYALRYLDGRGYPKVMPGCKLPNELAREIAPFTFARTKAEVAPDLPPNIRKFAPVLMTPQQARIYREIKHAIDAEIQVTGLADPMFIGSALTQLVRLQQVSTDPTLIGSSAPSAKLEWLYDWIEGNPDEPVIVFTLFRDTALRLAQRLGALPIVGGRAVGDYRRNRLVATIAAGAEALDLGHIRTAIFVDVSWRQILMNQAIARIHRINITEPKHTIYLYSANTVDELVLAGLEAKWTETELLLSYIRGDEVNVRAMIGSGT